MRVTPPCLIKIGNVPYRNELESPTQGDQMADRRSDVQVTSIRKIYDDGNHNAFTSLCQFRGRLYLAFRSSPSGHGVMPDSRIVILTSEDGHDWEEAFSYSLPNRDPRDPHFLIFNDRLMVYSGTWYYDPDVPAERNWLDHLGHAVWTDDGTTWQGPQALEGTKGYYIWDAAAHDGKAYLCGRRIGRPSTADTPAVRESVILQSDDGFKWESIGIFQSNEGNETALLFEEDGTGVAVARRQGNARLCRAQPPYEKWTCTDLGQFIGGPMLARWGDHYLVGGRALRTPKEPGRNPRTVLWWLIDDELVEIAELPSGGDNSYPGFVPLSDTHGLLSYYSSHEGSGGKEPPCSIYLAELQMRGNRATTL